MVATSPVEREFRGINRRTEVGARWSDEGVDEGCQASGGGEDQWNETRILRLTS